MLRQHCSCSFTEHDNGVKFDSEMSQHSEHNRIRCNEIVDDLAGLGAGYQVVGPEPVILYILQTD